MFSINNIIDDKITSVNGTPGNIVMFGLDGTISDSGIPASGSPGGGQAKQPSAIPNNIAVFGSGPNQGQTIDSGINVNDLSGPSSTILWSSAKINSLVPSGGPFLPISGGTMTGPINIALPSSPTNAANKAYVDAQVIAGVPDATTTTLGKIQLSGDFDSTSTATVPVIKSATGSVQGKIQLAGDLTGTASAPLLANNVVALPNFANLAAMNKLLGSSDTSTAVSDISIGNGLEILSGILQADVSDLSGIFLPLAGGTMSGNIIVPSGNLITVDDPPTLAATVANKAYVDANITPSATPVLQGKIQLAGDLTGSASAPVVASGAITLDKMANLSAISNLIGSSSASTLPAQISLGAGLQMLGSSISVNTTSLSSSFLPLTGGTMSGTISAKNITIPTGNFISITDAPTSGTSAANKLYVDSQIISATPNATTTSLGKIQLSGDLAGTALLPVITTSAVTLSKMANLTTTSALIGSSSTSTSPAQISLGTSLSMTGNTLNVVPVFNNPTFNGAITGSAVVPVANGGSGATSLTGYIIGNGTSPFTASATIPVANVTGAVRSVNGILPDLSGNVVVALAGVMTGTLAGLPPVGPPLVSGDIYVVSGDPTPANNGRTFIYSTSPNAWLEITPNLAATDARYLQLAGGTMAGNISVPTSYVISITDAPTAATSAANKAYVDANITPSATTILQGKIQLAGDLTGTATTPTVAPNAITLGKLANLGGTSQIIGSGSASSSATNLSLGSNLTITGTTLNVNTSSLSGTFLPLAGGTMSGTINSQNISVPTSYVISITDAPTAATSAANKAYVDANITPSATTILQGKIQLAGDLTGTATTPTVAPNAITLGKLANLTSTMSLIGSSSVTNAAANITLGSNLQISGTVLNVNTSALSGTFLPLSGGTMAGNIIVPTGNVISIADAPTVGTSATNKSYVDAQIASATPQATAAVFGTIKLAGDLTGTAGTPTIATNAVTITKLANLGGTQQLLGSGSASTSAANITLGSSLQISGTTLSANISNLSTIFLPLAGGTMAGNIVVPTGDLISIADAPAVGTSAANKAYVDAQVSAATPNATTTVLGKIQLAGDFDPTSTATVPVIKSATASVLGKIQLAGDLTGSATAPTVAANAITVGKLANLTGTSQLLGSSSASASATNVTLGSNLQMTGAILNVNTSALSGTFLPLAGGTMAGNIVVPTGDLISIADAPAVGTSAANKAYVDAQISAATPNATTTVLGKIQLAGDFDPTSTATVPVIKSATASVLGKIQLAGDFDPTSTATVPVIKSATASVLGKIQLAGDLTGSATAPTVAANAITVGKLANLTGTSQLLGSSSASASATNVTLGSNLQMTGTVLNVNTSALSGTFLPLAGGTMAGNIIVPTGDLISIADAPAVGTSAANKAYVDAQISAATPNATTTVLGKIQLAGDFDPTSTATVPVIKSATASVLGKIQLAGDLTGSATAPTVAANAITVGKLANLTGTSQLLGSSSASASATNVTLGSNLQMTGSVLSVNASALSFMALVPAAVSGNLATYNASGQVIDSGVAINNAGLTSASLWNAAKLAVTTNSWFAGTNPNVTAPTDRPTSSSVLYIGTDSSTWIYNGSTYISLNQAKTVNTGVARTIQTSTGAVGFQVSSTLPSLVHYSITISTTIGVGGTSTGTIFLETSPTNSATPASWIVNAQSSNSQSFAGLLTLTSVQVQTTEVSTYVPAGYFVKIRSTSSGTASFTYVTGTEVLG
ncbi:hypothetical protein IIV31_026R [Armadillidium vulgare iridescent virus]|uniref:Uncharacterized protein n=1 Tax=Armadillidium vulgare iridescent virus TaxID=72201 RepID=A0A068QKP0_9VIRU|nr:hypothetical protein IIV31_026R [Armadillidium vulgare iridescent virus]CCV02398.1 hypothetical protein IIV31_026R [Armadillidium vulgare iridescent virus]